MMELENRNLNNTGIYFTKKFTELESTIEIERIIDTRVGKDCKRHYLVSFKSWLTEDKLHEYEGLIEQFWKERSQIGWSNKHDDESHSDKENKYIPENEHAFNNAPLIASPLSYEKHSPSSLSPYEQHSPSSIQKHSPSFEEHSPTFPDPDKAITTENGHRTNGSQEQEECLESQFNDEEENFAGNNISVEDHESHAQNQVLNLVNQENNLNNREHKNILDKKEICAEVIDEQEETSEPLENSDDSTETVDVSVGSIECPKKQEYDDDKSTRPASSFSDKTTSSTSDRPLSSSSDRLPKKRKLKTLDDIVRKISGTTDQPGEKKNCIDNLLTDRLQNLDKTLSDDYTKVKSEPAETLEANEPFIKSSPPDSREHKDQFSNGNSNGNRENVYWSAGKVILKQSRPFRCFTCDFKFEFEEHLIEHQRTHLNENETKMSPQEHQALNDIQRAYTCRHCGDNFRSIPELDQHRFEAHKGRRRYEKCQFCSTMYSDPTLLRRHEETHFRGYEQFRQDNNGKPPPLIHNESRAFPQYQRNGDHRNGRHQDGPNRQDVRNREDVNPRLNDRTRVEDNGNGRVKEDENHMQFERRRDGGNYRQEERIRENENHREISNDTEGNSVVRNPIRHLLGKMYHSQQDGVPPLQRDPDQNPRSPRDVASITVDSIPHRYAEFMQETHGYPAAQDSTQFEQPSPVMTVPRSENIDEREVLHICPVCKKAFGKKDAFLQHYIGSHGDRPVLSCNGCRETFQHGKKVFHSHLRSHLQRGYECGVCEKIFYTSPSFEAHLQSHGQERPFQCHICGRNFSSCTNLRRHVMMHLEITPFRCHLCSKSFKIGEELNAHIQEFHGRVIAENEARKHLEKDERFNEGRHYESANGNNSPSPVYHQHRYENKQNLKKRQFRNQDHYIDDTKKYPFDPNMKFAGNPSMHYMPPVQHVAIDPNMRRSNDSEEVTSSHQLLKMVPAMTPSQYSPVKPTVVHMFPQPPVIAKMKCIDCDEEFTSQSLYEIHMQSHIKQVYSCKKCPKTFNKKSQYNSHNTHAHEGNKSHNCPYCHRSFSMKGNLRRHIRIHTNEAPYECPICFQRFRRSDGLKGHIKRHETMGETAPTDMVPSQASAQVAN